MYVSADNPTVLDATNAVQRGDIERLDALLMQHTWLTTARFGDHNCYRTLLHVATDWPGNFPNGPLVIQRLIAAGADVNAPSRFDSHSETALHWAASSNDVPALDALLDAGADIEAPGAVLGGGSALADACGFSNWAAARRLVERGAKTRLMDAAALGLLERLEAAFASGSAPAPDEITQALWSACKGGQFHAAAFLMDRGADINWLGWDNRTPLDAAESAHATELAQLLRDRGAKRSTELNTYS